MTDAREQVNKVKELLDGSRIAADTRKAVAVALGPLAGSQPVAVEDIASPFVPETDPYYWQFHDRATARALMPGRVTVGAARIAAEPESDGRAPSGWYPRVVVTLQSNDHELTGDLDRDAAIDLAHDLLAAAALVRR